MTALVTTIDVQPKDERELVLCRRIEVPREKLFRCWTEPDLLKQWFAPRPWSTSDAQLDVRTGGANRITMRSPEGQDFPNSGVYLEVVPNAKLVFTDAFTEAWVPSEKPFFVGVLTFEEEGGATRYTARARHWTKEDCDAHAAMGFHEGWGRCTEQLAELAATL
jgi:uncharacterized protein YndB with AHSA1/START domain